MTSTTHRRQQLLSNNSSSSLSHISIINSNPPQTTAINNNNYHNNTNYIQSALKSLTEESRPFTSVALPECSPERCINDTHFNADPKQLPKYQEDDIKVIKPTLSTQPVSFKYEPRYLEDDLQSDVSLSKTNNRQSCLKYCEDLLQKAEQELKQKTSIYKSPDHIINNNHADDSDNESGGEEEIAGVKKMAKIQFHFAWPEPPVVADKIRYFTFTASLPTDTMTHTDLLSYLEKDPTIRIPITPEMLSLLISESAFIGNPAVRYHIKPFHIKIIEEHNELPIPFNVQLTSKLPNVTTRQQWVSPTGPNIYGGEVLPMLNYVTLPGIKRTSTEDHINLYLGSEHILNDPDAIRWLDVNEDYLKTQMKSKIKPGGAHYFIEVPEQRYTATDVLQFIVVSEFDRIIKLSMNSDLVRNVDLPVIITAANQVKMFQINAAVLNHIIDQKFMSYNKKQLLMRLEDLYITLTPMRQLDRQWHKDLTTLANTMKQAPPYQQGYYTRYYVKIQIAYENYTGNKNEQQQHHQQQQLSSPNLMYSPPSATNATAPRTTSNNALGLDYYPGGRY